MLNNTANIPVSRRHPRRRLRKWVKATIKLSISGMIIFAGSSAAIRSPHFITPVQAEEIDRTAVINALADLQKTDTTDPFILKEYAIEKYEKQNKLKAGSINRENTVVTYTKPAVSEPVVENLVFKVIPDAISEPKTDLEENETSNVTTIDGQSAKDSNDSSENALLSNNDADEAVPVKSALFQASQDGIKDDALNIKGSIETGDEISLVNPADIKNARKSDDLADSENSTVTLGIKSENVVVNYGNAFIPTTLLTFINDSESEALPILSIESNVNTSQEGNYQVKFIATDAKGRSASKTVNVEVKKPNELIQKEEEEAAAKKAAEEKAEAERKAAEEAENQRIAALRQTYVVAATSSTITNPVGSASGIDLVNYARQFVGYPYVYGGNDPHTGADCSGFTKYVYANFGINLNRTAASQALNGYQIDASEAKAGDLMIWTGHVAIYEGNGWMIHSTNPYSGVCETTANTGYGSGGFLGYFRIPGIE